MRLPNPRLVDRVDKIASIQVGWISPLEQDIYGPGSRVLAEWTSPRRIECPSFQVCMASVGECSSTVRPEVTESAGVYQATVTIPDSLSDGSFFLQMKDDSGAESRSPVFTLCPQRASNSSNDSDSIGGSNPQAQAPLRPVNPPVVPEPSSLFPKFATSTSISSPTTSSQVSTATPADSGIISAKASPPLAAYIAPCTAALAILLLAAVLLLKRRRKRTADPQRSEKTPSRTNSYKSNASGRSQVNLALCALSRHYPFSAASPSAKTSKARPTSMNEFPSPSYAQWSTGLPSPSYSHAVHHGHRDIPPLAAQPQPPHQNHAVPTPTDRLRRDERPSLPPISTTSSFMSSRSDPATHAILSNYILPSPPPLSSSSLSPASPPRCLLPAPQQLHMRDLTHPGDVMSGSPLGRSPQGEMDGGGGVGEGQLYDRVASKLSLYRPRRT
ncbi:hypothetical protein R3P38DRAFT_82260 [Favolaschia claudopus]|uniref:Uncharacterized protein n=1 Tax=Favolaschia claudopus TaxID=2862362 RepID=A0AAW0D5V6_9AGAR